MPHFVTLNDPFYAPFQIEVANHSDEFALLPSSAALLARLVNGDYNVLSKFDIGVGELHNPDGQMIRVRDIDTTAKSLTVMEIQSDSDRRGRGRGRR